MFLMSQDVARFYFFMLCVQDFVGAGFCRSGSFGTEQQRSAAMTCEGCSIKFTVFKRRVSPLVYCAREVIFCHLIHDAVSIQTRGLRCDASQGFHSCP